MKQIELTSKLVLAIIGITSVGAILVPTYAVPTIRSADIFDETIVSADLKDGAAVKSSDIVNGEVKAEDLASGAVMPNVHVHEGGAADISPGTIGGASANCASGEILTGGGFKASKGVQIITSNPLNDDTWEASAFNPGSELLGIKAYAVCIGPSP
jgi:hypothetical protein